MLSLGAVGSHHSILNKLIISSIAILGSFGEISRTFPTGSSLHSLIPSILITTFPCFEISNSSGRKQPRIAIGS